MKNEELRMGPGRCRFLCDRCHDGDDFIGFLHERMNPLSTDNLTFLQETKPVQRLACFFQRDPKSSVDVCLCLRSPCFFEICTDARRRPEELIHQWPHSARRCQRPIHPHNPADEPEHTIVNVNADHSSFFILHSSFSEKLGIYHTRPALCEQTLKPEATPSI
jgi:hypothetical protein